MAVSKENQTVFYRLATSRRRSKRRQHVHPAKDFRINTPRAIKRRSFRTLFRQFTLLTGRTHGLTNALRLYRFRDYGHQHFSGIVSPYILRRLRHHVSKWPLAYRYPLFVEARRKVLTNKGELVCLPHDLVHAADVSLGTWMIVNSSARGALVSKTSLNLINVTKQT